MTRSLTLVALVLALAIPSSAAADVKVLSADGAELASFKSASCRKGSKKLLSFTATARSKGYKLTVDIFGGLRRSTNLVYGGDGNAQFTVKGPGGSWTNLNRPPDAPPGGGAIQFNANYKRMGLGFVAAFDQSFSSTVGVGGGLDCKYPPKKKKKRRR